jgi:low temperature requirement protein LtrA
MVASTTPTRAPAHGLAAAVLSNLHLLVVAAMWVAAAVLSVSAPDMVTGSEQEHLPIAVLTVWLWAVIATAFVLMTPRSEATAAWAVTIGLVWTAIVVIGLAAPSLVTGTDPTTIPLGVLIAPPVGSLVTGLICMRAATSR